MAYVTYFLFLPHNLNGVINMFMSINRETLGLVALSITGFIILGVFGALENKTEPVSAMPSSGKTIIIDAGHGGFDGGASDNGIEEKEVNLDVALRLKEYVEQSGGIAVMTREEDVSTAKDGLEGLMAKKSDLTERKNMATAYEGDAFVSVHMNKFQQSKYKGAQVFYANDEMSKKLGDEIQNSLKEVLNDGNERVAKKTEGGVLILKDATVPSVIVECGFLSNPREAELLKTDEYRQKLAFAIYTGIVNYFNN